MLDFSPQRRVRYWEFYADRLMLRQLKIFWAVISYRLEGTYYDNIGTLAERRTGRRRSRMEYGEDQKRAGDIT